MRGLGRYIRKTYWDRLAVMAPVLVRDYRRNFGAWPNLARPRTFNEKILFRMLFDRRPILTALAGKFEARRHVIRRLGSDALLPSLYAAVHRETAMEELSLPPSYIMKASHASGLVRIVEPESAPDKAMLKATVRDWLAVDFGRDHCEWCYRNLERIVIFEELLRHEGQVPKDYKFFCFDGRPTYIQVDTARFEHHTQSIFDRGWNRLDVQVLDYAADAVPPLPPVALNEMLGIAERLSAGLDFVRVDLFDVGGTVRVGEMTNYPQAGTGRFHPAFWDVEFGRHWTLPPLRVLQDRQKPDTLGGTAAMPAKA